MWSPSKETREALVWASDIEDEPQLYPKEVVDALKRIEEMEAVSPGSSCDHDFMYGIKGYVIRDSGVVGIRPDAPEIAKREWACHWEEITHRVGG